MLFPRSHTIDSIFIVLLFKKPCLGERGRKIGAMRDERGRCGLAPEKGEGAQKREGREVEKGWKDVCLEKEGTSIFLRATYPEWQEKAIRRLAAEKWH